MAEPEITEPATTLTDALAGPDWLVVPLPSETKRGPRKWAASTTYDLFPWYTRPFKTGEVIATAAMLESYSSMSSPELRFAVYRPQAARVLLPAIAAVRTDPTGTEPLDAAPGGGLRGGQRVPWSTSGSLTWPYLDADDRIVGRRWHLPSESATTTITVFADDPGVFDAAAGPADGLVRRVSSAAREG